MLRAYLDPISVGPGDRVQVMVSTDASTYRVEVARLLHGDPNPEGPGVLDQIVDWLDSQERHPGRSGEVEHLGQPRIRGPPPFPLPLGSTPPPIPVAFRSSPLGPTTPTRFYAWRSERIGVSTVRFGSGGPCTR